VPTFPILAGLSAVVLLWLVSSPAPTQPVPLPKVPPLPGPLDPFGRPDPFDPPGPPRPAPKVKVPTQQPQPQPRPQQPQQPQQLQPQRPLQQPPARPGVAPAQPNPPRPQPRLDPVAETKLLMEGLLDANLRGLSNTLRQPPADVQTWLFGRGQALLIAETANLLMLRPPRGTAGQAEWMERATELREAAVRLAQAAAAQNYVRSRTGLAEVAIACNRCHQRFQVNVKVNPFVEP